MAKLFGSAENINKYEIFSDWWKVVSVEKFQMCLIKWKISIMFNHIKEI